MAGLLEKLQQSFLSKLGEKLAECGWEAVTGNKDPKFILKTLQRSLKSLSDKACDVKDQIKHGEQSGKMKRKREVENWLEEVSEIENELGSLQNEVQEEGFLGRFFGEGRVSELNTRVCELVEQSRHFGEQLLVARENWGELLLTTRLTGEMFEKNIKIIWEWLVNDNVKSIGIYGMGGVGKTTLAKHINNRLRNENRRVYWVTVSQLFTTNKLQSDIAKVIDLDLSDEENEDKRAGRLNQALSKKEDFVLILDDVWSDIDLEKMGDPLHVEGCRLIVTTRSLTVCHRIDCRQIIEMKTLQTNESWTLFRETLGDITTITSEVEEIAKLVAGECDGLPLGIIVLAKSMKGVTDIHEWRNVYIEIRESPMELDEMKEKVFRVLKYSFDRLNPKLQLCFLYCSLYPEDYAIHKDKLVRRFISEELVDTRKTLEEQLDQGYAILSQLLNLCLLECTSIHRVYVKMHDLVRDMAIKIAKESSKYKVFAGLGLEKLPNKEEWTEDVDKISLMSNKIVKIPSGMAPNCPKLSTLLLNENPLKSIPESFFAQMSSLHVLDLSRTQITRLPNSISDLESLNTLLLSECIRLASVPDLGKLKALRELDLSKTSITRLPNSISDLESVYRLCLSNCSDLVFVPSLEKLEALRELDLSDTSIKDMPEGLENLINLKMLLLPLQIEVPVYEIEGSKQLRTFVGRFKDVSDFNWFQSQTGGLISNYLYVVGNDGFDALDSFSVHHGPNFLSMDGCSLRRERENRVIIPPGKICELKIMGCKGLSSCVLDDFKLCSSVTEVLRICDCEGIESIWNINGQLMEETRVNFVSLNRLPDLKGLVNWEEGGGPGRLPCPPPQAAKLFSSLQSLIIHDCNKMKTLGLPLPCLHNIVYITVGNCAQIGELMELAEDDEGISEPTHSLPNLKRLSLFDLPKLESIYKARIDCKSIEKIEIRRCPRVKKLPLFLPSSSSSDGQVINCSPPPALKEITIGKESWESLEWDDPTHKHLLQPFVKCGINRSPAVYFHQFNWWENIRQLV